MLHRVVVGIAASLYGFALLFGILLPLVWHPFKLLTDADYGREHQQRGVAVWRGTSEPTTDSERRIRLDELQRVRDALADAGAGPTALEVIDARAQRLRKPRRQPAPRTAAADPVAANARHFLWAVAAASIASVLLAVDGYFNARRQQ
jgi:hypothetical protein